jgi:hypothetical protein
MMHHFSSTTRENPNPGRAGWYGDAADDFYMQWVARRSRSTARGHGTGWRSSAVKPLIVRLAISGIGTTPHHTTPLPPL